MKTNNFSIKWKLFFYMIIFVFLLLCILWLLQTVLLNDFYKAVKTRQLKNVAKTISANIDSEDLDIVLERFIKRDEGITIMILNESGEVLHPGYNDRQVRGMLVLTNFDEFIRKINEKGELYLEKRVPVPAAEAIPSPSTQPGILARRAAPVFRESESIVTVSKIKNQQEETIYVLISAMITPVDATVETIKYQLILISGILLVLALIIALVISKKFASPIMDINLAAKQLSLGNYDVKFAANGYREIDELNETLNKAAYELSKLESFRRELIANVSHDLRTPLTMIIGFAEMIRDLPGEYTPENAQIIINESNHLKRFVSELLDISKFTSDNDKISKEVFSLTELVEETADRIKEMYSQSGGADIILELSGNVYINANRMEIAQVIYNLLTNAVNYSEDSVTIKQQLDGGAYVVIQVCDKGPGIPKEDLPYVWDRYYKSKLAHRRNPVGTGLGLSIVKSVINRHKGYYGVTSTEGEGSSFWFKLAVVPDVQ